MDAGRFGGKKEEEGKEPFRGLGKGGKGEGGGQDFPTIFLFCPRSPRTKTHHRSLVNSIPILTYIALPSCPLSLAETPAFLLVEPAVS